MRRLTIRARLTVLYGGLFLAAGIVLLALTYVLVGQRLPDALGIAVEAPINASELPIAVSDLPERVREATLRQLLIQGGTALAMVTVIAVGFGWLLAGRALQPLYKITETARRIGGTDGPGRGLHERIAIDGPPDEIKELADTFDTMLARLHQSFDGQRRFVANASHELRTPLAINRAVVELAITRPDATEDVRRLGETLLAVNGRHERLIDGLLMLADSENEVTERSPVDLAEVVDHTLEEAGALAALARENGVSVQPGQLEPAPTTGDPVLLERLVFNLVDNAVRHNHSGGWLSASTGAGPAGATVLITNTGPVIPRYDVDTLFQPFRRLAATGPNRGFGLGLSIVRAIAQAHGGTVRARPRDGGGLLVEVTLPK